MPTHLFLFTMLCAFSFISSNAQTKCGFDSRHTSSFDSLHVTFLEKIIAQSQQQLWFREPIVLPVVFHVVYSNPEENISDLQIRSQIDILNRDFAYLSENAPWVPSEFKSLGGDSGIRFCLASIDPHGNATSGITRTQTTVPFIGQHREPNGRMSVYYDVYGGKNGWDPERYINVWVADMEGLLGSATFPGMAPHPEEDGVIIDPWVVGGVGLGANADPFDRGHTLTHELGHYFGLYHIWGPGSGGCDVDDLVDDTPEQESPYLGCPDYPQHSCGTSDMFMNFMDFTNDRCLALFTKGQVARMQGALMGLRSTLLENMDACAPPDNGKIHLDEAVIYYAPISQQIIIALDEVSITTCEVALYAIDGRLLHASTWSDGSVFWLNTHRFAPGIYVVRLESGGESVSRKVVVGW